MPFQVRLDILMAKMNAQFAALAKQVDDLNKRVDYMSQFLDPDKLEELEEIVSLS